jgi:hypothetical protein
MKLGFFTVPIHPLGKDWRQSLREDREAFELCWEPGVLKAPESAFAYPLLGHKKQKAPCENASSGRPFPRGMPMTLDACLSA